jgi:ribosome-associated heat shock protein Hsp15
VSTVTSAPEPVRLDKWLWAARFVKTRALAAAAIAAGHVQLNGETAKASKIVKPGDEVRLALAREVRTVVVQQTSTVRGPAPKAQALYSETPESIRQREAAQDARRLGVEPALTHAQGRPSGRDRRQAAQWQRWSASLDDTA